MENNFSTPTLKLRDAYPTRKLKVALKWKDGRPLGEVTVKAEAAQGGNPAAKKLADGVYQFTILESARYTFSAWEDLDPQHAAPQRKGAATCPLPARIDSDSVTVDGADEAASEITLTFAPPPCKPENDQPTAPATPPTPAEASRHPHPNLFERHRRAVEFRVASPPQIPLQELLECCGSATDFAPAHQKTLEKIRRRCGKNHLVKCLDVSGRLDFRRRDPPNLLAGYKKCQTKNH